MKHALDQWWTSRSPQERRVLVAASLCLGLALYVWLLQATTHARERLLPAVTTLRADALRQGEQADEILRLRAIPPPPASTMELRHLVHRQVDASGLTRALVSIEQLDTRHVKVVFGSVAFTDWLAWADTIQAQHVRFAAVRVEAQPAAGQVSATATLERPGR
jgi:type II secretory pathway component PulM